MWQPFRTLCNKVGKHCGWDWVLFLTIGATLKFYQPSERMGGKSLIYVFVNASEEYLSNIKLFFLVCAWNPWGCSTHKNADGNSFRGGADHNPLQIFLNIIKQYKENPCAVSLPRDYSVNVNCGDGNNY